MGEHVAQIATGPHASAPAWFIRVADAPDARGVAISLSQASFAKFACHRRSLHVRVPEAAPHVKAAACRKMQELKEHHQGCQPGIGRRGSQRCRRGHGVTAPSPSPPRQGSCETSRGGFQAELRLSEGRGACAGMGRGTIARQSLEWLPPEAACRPYSGSNARKPVARFVYGGCPAIPQVEPRSCGAVYGEVWPKQTGGK